MRQIGTNEATRYELVATNGERTILVAYTARNSRTGAIAALTDNLSYRLGLLADATGTKAHEWATKRGKIAYNGDWEVKFTGRTQRTVAVEGELEDTIYPKE